MKLALSLNGTLFNMFFTKDFDIFVYSKARINRFSNHNYFKMKYLITALIGLFITTGHAQLSELTQVNSLINTFTKDKNVEALEEAESLISDLFNQRDFRPTANALYSKAKVMALLIQNKEVEDPLAYSKKIKETYAEALEADTEMKYRFDLLNDLYLAKIKMMDIGNKIYEQEDFGSAHEHYQNALSLNQLEIKYPRHAKLDTSLLFTSAVFASLAKKNKEAIRDFETLLAMDYPRKDLYDYLYRLYSEEGLEAKAKKIEALKEERFPE